MANKTPISKKDVPQQSGGFNADMFSSIVEGIGLLNNLSQIGGQNRLDENFFKGLQRRSGQAIGTLTQQSGDIRESFQPLLDMFADLANPRTASLEGTVQQGALGVAKQAADRKLRRSQFASGRAGGGVALGQQRASDRSFARAGAEIKASELSKGRQGLFAANTQMQNMLTALATQIAQLRATTPQFRERDPGLIGGIAGGVSDFISKPFG